MLVLASLSESRQFDLSSGENWLIVRKPPAVIPAFFEHVPALSPSPTLFKKAQEWKAEYTSKSDWWEMYEQAFLFEMEDRIELKHALSRLRNILQEGKLVRLFCYCPDVHHCHRQYIGKWAEKQGFEVDYREKPQTEQLSLF